MRLLTYQMPDELLTVASAGEFNEFDLNEFFAATGTGKGAQFKHKSDVQKWLDIIRGQYMPKDGRGPKDGLGATVPLFECAAAAIHAAFFLVSAKRCGMPRDGEFAGRETQCLLA